MASDVADAILNGDGIGNSTSSASSLAPAASASNSSEDASESRDFTDIKEHIGARNAVAEITKPETSSVVQSSQAVKMNEEGFLLWGRVKGYSYWPGVITVDPEEGLTEWKADDSGGQFPKYHVHFLGYENQRAWLSERSIMEYNGYEDYKKLAEGVKGPKRKEFYPASKALMKNFLKGVDLAEKARALPPQERLPMLGFVYVLIEPKKREKSGKSKPDKTLIDSGVKSPANSAQNGSGAKQRKSKKRKRSEMSPRNNKVENGKQKTVETGQKAPHVIKSSTKSHLDVVQRPNRTDSPIIPLYKYMNKDTDDDKPIKIDPYDFDEDDDEAEFALPPPKKIRMVAPGEGPLVKSSTETQRPLMKPKTAKSPLPPKLVKGSKSRSTKTPRAQKSSSPIRVARQSSPKRAMAVKKPTKTYSRPGKEGSPIDEGFDDDAGPQEDEEAMSSVDERPKPLPLPSVSVSVPKYSDPIEDIREYDEDDFASESESSQQADSGDEPKLGSLAWGRMRGFSYWPCFITKSPGGEYKRDHGPSTKRVEYHAQFFNWNNESAWLSKTMPWTSMDEYKKRAAAISKNKSPAEWKAWHPVGKGMAKKWEKAYGIAHSTVNLSRRDRCCKFLAHCHGRRKVGKGAAMDVPVQAPEKMPSTAKNGKGKMVSTPSTSGDKPLVENVGLSLQKQTKAVKRSTAGPACKKAKLQAIASLSSPLTSKSILLPADLPPGWSVINCNHGPFQEFRSPDGVTFDSLIDVVRNLFGQNTAPMGRRRSYSFSGMSSCLRGEDNEQGWFLEMSDVARFGRRVELTDDSAGIVDSHIQLYIDDSLPKEWLVKTTRVAHGGHAHARARDEEVLFIDPKQRWFSSKVEVAAFIEPKGHPAVEMAHIMAKTLKRNALVPLPVDLSLPIEDNPVLRDLRDNMSYVELVKLPEVFIQHPSVKVTEEANEMVIEDAITGDFIAKKIMYDGA